MKIKERQQKLPKLEMKEKYNLDTTYVKKLIQGYTDNAITNIATLVTNKKCLVDANYTNEPKNNICLDYINYQKTTFKIKNFPTKTIAAPHVFTAQLHQTLKQENYINPTQTQNLE